MRDVEEVTARGRGFWGRLYDVELLVRSTTRLDSSGRQEQTTRSFDFRVLDSSVGTYGFESEQERDAFLAAQFSDLVLASIAPTEMRLRPYPLAELIGQGLESVTFVGGCAQLGFLGPSLHSYIWPRIYASGAVLTRSNAGYLEALVGLIGTAVSSVDELLDYGLVVDFEGGTRLAIPLDGTELSGPEAASYNGEELGEMMMIWRPGDILIEWI